MVSPLPKNESGSVDETMNMGANCVTGSINSQPSARMVISAVRPPISIFCGTVIWMIFPSASTLHQSLSELTDRLPVDTSIVPFPPLASKVVSDLIMYAFARLLSSLSHAADKRQSNKMK